VFVATALGWAFGATEIGVIAAADVDGHSSLTGVLFAAWSLGSLVTGLIVARRPTTRAADVWMAALLAVLSVMTALLSIPGSVLWLGVGLVLAGAAVAPLLSAVYAVMPSVAPEGTLTEAFTLETSGMMIGLALGSAVAGWIADASSVQFTFLAAAVAAAGAAFLVRVRARTLQAESATT
jgi:MFS family permease